MPPESQDNENSESTSGSTTGSSTGSSSSSGSSSSGSDSSSSSDSDSSTSQESSPTKESQKPAPPNAKKAAVIKPPQRKSVENARKDTPHKAEENDNKNTAKSKSTSNVKATKAKTNLIDSSDDDTFTNKQTTKGSPKRKPLAKPKSTATVTPKQFIQTKQAANKPAPKTANSVAKNANYKSPVKTNEKPAPKAENNADKKNKKKSIFSPENSSESDTPVTSKLAPMKSKAKVVPQKPRQKVWPRANVEKPKVPEKPKVSPREEKKPVPVKHKPSVSSDSSMTSDSSDSSHSSDSESTGDSVVTTRTAARKTNSTNKSGKRTISNAGKENNLTDSEAEISNTSKNTNKTKTVTRKLTRSANTRKSKHVLGKSMFTDTDSDTESTKRSLSKSPVKRAPVAKGKTKNNKRNDAKSKPADSGIVLEERKCPIENCDSTGHLSGKYEKHFTVEACPLFHNTTALKCKDVYNDRKKHEEERKKAQESFRKSPRLQHTIDQKNYLQKIKDLRRKFELENNTDIKPLPVDKNREPDFTNVVPDYDLRLFREAQANASDKIEEDLKTLPYTKGTKYIEMGKYEMEVWYQSPYPEDYARLPKLYLCEYCLRYMKSRTILQRHVVKCVWRHPPGEEVYRKDKICVWEVDGKKYKLYCQNLCLLAKFFLDHKTLYYDVEPFLFYVMTIADNEGCHTVGYFSKEKNSFLNYNVSCILTLPPYQRQGYGRLLIDFSYLLTRVEGKTGSPEKPLSDLGLISYRSYWKDVLLAYLCATTGNQLSIKDISQEMAVNSYDIVSTLQALSMMKYWKGKHIILKKQDVLDEYVARQKRRGPSVKEVDPNCLKWKPFVAPQPPTL